MCECNCAGNISLEPAWRRINRVFCQRLDVKLKVESYSDRHSPADGTLPEVPTADYTASIASLKDLFGNRGPQRPQANLEAGWEVDLVKQGRPPIRWQGPQCKIESNSLQQAKVAQRYVQTKRRAAALAGRSTAAAHSTSHQSYQSVVVSSAATAA